MPDHVTDPTQLRKLLLSNGYEPLPLDGKRCYVPKWSTVEIDDTFIDQYRRNAKLSNTGIRCGNVLAVDIDVDDEHHADAIELIADQILGRTEFCRFGKGFKRLLVYWIDEPIRKQRSAKYGGHQVEILSRGSQFVAYGIHPDTNEPYEWVEDHPATSNRYAPQIFEKQINEFLDAVDDYFEDTGLELDNAKNPGGCESEYDFRLMNSDCFHVTDPPLGIQSVTQIKQQIGSETWCCNLTAIRPNSDSGAGRISLTSHGLRVSDFVKNVTYFERQDLEAETAQLAEVLPAPPQDGSMFEPDGAAVLEELLADYCYVAADDTVRRLDSPALGLRLKNFATSKRVYVRVPTHQRPVLVTTAWLEHPEAKRVQYMALRPDLDDRLFKDNGHRYLNTYTAPRHPDNGGSMGVFDEFMAHLVPDEGERDLVRDWIATKIQRPDYRMHALVMVAADTFGTGRGTLSTILERLLGREYTTETHLDHLLGVTTQSQYNDYLANALLVSVPEALDLSKDRNDWYARQRAYETIKRIVESSSRQMLIVRKGVANITQAVYASLFIATNHRNVLAIAENDRRLLVVSNGSEMPQALAERVYAWLEDRANVGALWRDLRARECRYDPFGLPPMTDAKRYMLAASQSGLDEAWAMFVDKAPGDVCTPAQWRAFALKAARTYDLDIEMRAPLDAMLNRILTNRGYRVYPSNSNWQIRIDGAIQRPWIIRNNAKWSNTEDVDGIKAEIIKNGEPGGVILEF